MGRCNDRFVFFICFITRVDSKNSSYVFRWCISKCLIKLVVLKRLIVLPPLGTLLMHILHSAVLLFSSLRVKKFHTADIVLCWWTVAGDIECCGVLPAAQTYPIRGITITRTRCVFCRASEQSTSVIQYKCTSLFDCIAVTMPSRSPLSLPSVINERRNTTYYVARWLAIMLHMRQGGKWS